MSNACRRTSFGEDDVDIFDGIAYCIGCRYPVTEHSKKVMTPTPREELRVKIVRALNYPTASTVNLLRVDALLDISENYTRQTLERLKDATFGSQDVGLVNETVIINRLKAFYNAELEKL